MKILIAKVHEFEVAMTCKGCSGAVERNLNKIKGKRYLKSKRQTICFFRTKASIKILPHF